MDGRKWSSVTIIAAYVLGIVALMVLAISTSFVQALQGSIPDFQLALARALAQGISFLVIGLASGTSFRIKRESIPALLYLSLAYLAYNVGFFGAAAHLPLGEISGIIAIVNIITAFIHAKIVLNMEIQKIHIASSMICLIGVLMTAQPKWIFRNVKNTDPSGSPTLTKNDISNFIQNHLNVSEEMVNPAIMKDIKGNATVASMSGFRKDKNQLLKINVGYVMAIIGGIGFGITYDANAVLLSDVTPMVKATHTSIACVFTSAAFMFYLEAPVFFMDLKQFAFISGHCVFSVLSYYLNFKVSHVLGGTRLSVVYSFEVLLMLISQYTVMKSIMPGNHNWLEVCGGLILVVGAMLPPVIDLVIHNRKADILP